MKFKQISEDFVQFVWKFGLFNQSLLQTTTGENIQVVFPGEQNLAGGPDFFKSKVLIDDTLWVGTVEIHLTSKEWKTHKHQADEAYNNLIIHVVYEGKGEAIQLQNERIVPTLIIGHRVLNKTLKSYIHLLDYEEKFIPCKGLISTTDAFLFHHLYQVLSIERLQQKIVEIEQDLFLTQGDLDMAFIRALFKHFGSPLNKGPFEILSRSFSLQQLTKQSHNNLQMESFLFGLANMLHNQDEYAKRLANEFVFSKNLYQLQVHCKASTWKFAGARPTNFPSIRLAQLSALLVKDSRPFTAILGADGLQALYTIFDIELSPYWTAHYAFGKKGKRGTKNLSKSFKDKLVLNVVIPFLFFYGKYTEKEDYLTKSFQLLESIRAEKNTIIKGYRELGFPCKNALESQALIQLMNRYCKPKRCLECKLGFHLLKSELRKA
ncbi:MAG: hypothetical protein ACI9O4_000026 [Chitinophagales bacterium]|jgi:hypothetical protein